MSGHVDMAIIIKVSQKKGINYANPTGRVPVHVRSLVIKLRQIIIIITRLRYSLNAIDLHITSQQFKIGRTIDQMNALVPQKTLKELEHRKLG